MNLRTLFAIPIAVVLLVTLSLAGMMAGQGWSSLARGKATVEAVERMRLLLEVQTDLRTERLASNLALGKPYPLPETVKRRFDDARRHTDVGIAALAESTRGEATAAPDPYLTSVFVSLAAVRAAIDTLVASGQGARTFSALDTVMPRMIAVSHLLEDPLARASIAVTEVDPSLSGLVIQDRLTASLRDQVGLIAAQLLPRYNMGEQPTLADLDQVRAFLARASYLTRLLDDTIEIAGATEQIRTALADLEKTDLGDILRRLNDQATLRPVREDADPPLPQLLLVPWGEQINSLRTAIMNATQRRVILRQVRRERQFDAVLTSFGAVMVAVLESVVLLSQRVVTPLAQLGLAIKRIAEGDRSIPLTFYSGTREINEMVTAVETLRQAALIADAADRRQRLAARQRLTALRGAVVIVQTLLEPARALERSVESLSEGMNTAIALIATGPTAPPPSLGAAAHAIQAGLAEMRDCAAGLEAMFAAADPAQTEDWPESEFVAHVFAVQAEVERRNAAVRGFIQPSLLGLRDTAMATGMPVLRDLVSDQFERVEATVAAVASMRDAVTRAASIVRDLPLEDAPLEDRPMAA